MTLSPAAYDTLTHHFEDTGRSPDYYDAIITGDLGVLGHELLRELFSRDGTAFGGCFTDCGILIFDPARQDVHSGGSGCGCSASVLAGHIMKSMHSGVWRRVLFAATGALMSPTSSMQGESIPGICHAVSLEYTEGGI